MGNIHLLPTALASQIAAGEVVERPSSALKELIENALDAGARRCDVVMQGGGITRLSVRDDGTGMAPEDARLALQRHATSKLTTFEDLTGVRSYGFRGEALPSIASVSRFSLETRSAEADAGTRVVVEGGADAEVSEIGMAVGTHVEVRDLFFNVPARRKFLRASATEAGHILDVVENAALACPDVTFTVERDGRRAREWLRAQSRAERVRACLGDEELTDCAGERGPLLLEAYLSRPERARSGAAGLKLFCNNRVIRDRAILSTVAQAFGSVLERGRYPRGVVYLDLPPELVDVNVHPQKTEVRFADIRAVTDAIYKITSAHLARAFALPRAASQEEALADASAPAPLARVFGPRLSPDRGVLAPQNDGAREANSKQATLMLSDRIQTTSYEQHDPTPSDAAPSPLASSDAHRPGESAKMVWSRLRFIAQVRATFLLCEGRDALYIIDQHAAAERVTFHRLREQYKASSLTSQSLLFPLTLEVRPEQSELIEAKQREMQGFGFELRVHSETTVSLHAVPKLLSRGSPERLVFDLLSEMSRSGRAFSDAVDTVLSTMACHGSIRSGDILSQQEASALLAELDKVDFAGHCPHGRPIVASTSWAELERKVGRR